MTGTDSHEWPSVTAVFLAYKRRDQLRESLEKTVRGSDYPGRLDVVVVDNASGDGTSEMVAEEFPEVRLITRPKNIGVSAWNEGFALADTDLVLALDDDCHLPAGNLRQAVERAREHGADLVSFAVTSSYDPEYRFDYEYRTGLLSFWGCAVLIRTDVVRELGGFDPEIFVWAHEMEFLMRFYDRGYRHLHLPEVVAVHDKEPGIWQEWGELPYRVNAHHFAYVACKLLGPRDALEATIALFARNVREARRDDPRAIKGLWDTATGVIHGVRHRRPVRLEVSRTYRRHFETFASPWWFARPLRTVVGDILAGRKGSARTPVTHDRERYFAERPGYYPASERTLKL